MPKLWKDPKLQQGWPENQSGFTTNTKQSANNRKWKKYTVKNQHYIPLQNTLFSVFLHICIVSFFFHFF